MHPVGEVAVDVEGQGRVADGDMELDLRGKERNKIPFLQRIIVSHLFKVDGILYLSKRFLPQCVKGSLFC